MPTSRTLPFAVCILLKLLFHLSLLIRYRRQTDWRPTHYTKSATCSTVVKLTVRTCYRTHKKCYNRTMLLTIFTLISVGDTDTTDVLRCAEIDRPPRLVAVGIECARSRSLVIIHSPWSYVCPIRTALEGRLVHCHVVSIYKTNPTQMIKTSITKNFSYRWNNKTLAWCMHLIIMLLSSIWLCRLVETCCVS